MVASFCRDIDIDSRGVARIGNTRFKVLHLVGAKLANGWSTEQLHEQFPDLSKTQIQAGLAYYAENQQEIDAAIDRDQTDGQALATGFEKLNLRQRLLAIRARLAA